MNEVQIKVDFEKQICEPVGINLITGDYNSTKLVFTFDKEDGTKLFKMKNPNNETIFAQEIIDNEVVLVGETQNGEPASLFTSAGDYVIEIALYDGDSRLTSISSILSVLPEQIVLDGGKEIEVYKPLFDQLIVDINNAIDDANDAIDDINDAIEEANAAIERTNNLDIDVSKEGTTSTVTVTKKDGTVKSVNILDATINGMNIIELVAGQNIILKQVGNQIIISATGVIPPTPTTETQLITSDNRIFLTSDNANFILKESE